MQAQPIERPRHQPKEHRLCLGRRGESPLAIEIMHRTDRRGLLGEGGRKGRPRRGIACADPAGAALCQDDVILNRVPFDSDGKALSGEARRDRPPALA